eukprot:2153713-Rhodomonas_salina.1
MGRWQWCEPGSKEEDEMIRQVALSPHPYCPTHFLPHAHTYNVARTDVVYGACAEQVKEQHKWQASRGADDVPAPPPHIPTTLPPIVLPA